jgi:hypothetical protein
MTWWSEYSAAPRCVLAKSAIRRRFVDRFVGSSVPSHVSGQRFSPRGTLLPSAGSRPARFPVFIGTTKVLRLPARAYLLPYCFGHRSHARLRCLWSQSAPGEFGGSPSGLEHLISRRSFPGVLHTRARAGSHRFPGDPSYAFALLQDPGRADKISPWRSCRCCPRSTQAEGPSGYIISRLTQSFSIRCLRFTSGVTASRARLTSDWRAAPLPGGGRTLWIASKGFRLHLHSPFQDFSCRKGGLR